MRLITTAPVRKPPRPPFGLPEWSAEAQAAAVLLDADGLDGDDDVRSVAGQIPGASTLPAGTVVVVLGGAARGGRFLSHLFGGSTVPVSRAARCAALIARGYVAVGAAIDEATKIEIAWGRAPDADGA